MGILPLIVGVVGLGSGIVCRSFFMGGVSLAVFTGLLALICFGAWYVLRVRVYLLAGICLLAGSVGVLRMGAVPAPPDVFSVEVGAAVSLTGTIVEDPDVRETSTRISVEVENGGEVTRVLAVAPRYPSHVYGERVVVTGVLMHPEPFATDGGREFRYDTYLAKDGIYFVVPAANVETLAPPSGFLLRAQGALYSAKHTFQDALADAIVEPYASLASGLLAGGKQGLGKDLLTAFTATGLLPIIVLSGYNIMIIAEGVLRSLRRLPKYAAVSIAALVLIVFLMAAGGGSSAVRAGIMAMIALFGRASGRTYDALRALLFAVVGMLLWNPLLLLADPGFQFSVAATLGLIVASSPLENKLTWIRNGLLREVLASTLAAQLFVLPLLLFQTGNLSIVSIPANMLVLPVVPLTMLMSFGAGIVSLLVPAIATLAGLPAYVLLWYIVAVAKFFATLPYASVVIPAFPVAAVPLMYVVVALVCWRLKKSEPTSIEAGSQEALPVILRDDEDPTDVPH